MRLNILLFFFSICLIAGTLEANGKKVSKIVLDAGHGGHDIGAKGQFSYEKDLTLAIVLKLGKILNDSMKDVQVLYTRTTDIYPTLTERHEIANQSNGDLFISVHINSNPGTTQRIQSGTRMVKHGRKKIPVPAYKVIHRRETTTQGTETWVLGLNRNSQKEGAIGNYSENVTEEPGLLNENDPSTAIIVAQYSQAFLSRSVSLGNKIQQAFASQGRVDFGVKQKGLEVLAGSAMPGVLVECGFINNPTEESYLNSESGQREAAMAIYKGIKAYKLETERK